MPECGSYIFQSAIFEPPTQSTIPTCCVVSIFEDLGMRISNQLSFSSMTDHLRCVLKRLRCGRLLDLFSGYRRTTVFWNHRLYPKDVFSCSASLFRDMSLPLPVTQSFLLSPTVTLFLIRIHNLALPLLLSHTISPGFSCFLYSFSCQSVRRAGRHTAILRGSHRAVTASRAC